MQSTGTRFTCAGMLSCGNRPQTRRPQRGTGHERTHNVLRMSNFRPDLGYRCKTLSYRCLMLRARTLLS